MQLSRTDMITSMMCSSDDGVAGVHNQFDILGDEVGMYYHILMTCLLICLLAWPDANNI